MQNAASAGECMQDAVASFGRAWEQLHGEQWLDAITALSPVAKWQYNWHWRKGDEKHSRHALLFGVVPWHNAISILR